MKAPLLPLLTSFPLAALLLAWVLYLCQRRGGRLGQALLGYYLLCLGLILFRWYWQPALALYDTSKYQSLAAEIAALLRADFWGNLPYILKPHAAYTIPLGFLFFLFGVSEPAGQLLNTALGMGIILNVHRLAQVWFQRRVADTAALFLACCPILWILGSSLNRDMMTAFGISLLFRLLSRFLLLREGGRLPWLTALGLAATLLWLGLLRPPLFLLGGLAVAVAWAVRRGSGSGWLPRLMRILLVTGLAAAAGFVVILAALYYQQVSPLDYEITQFADLQKINQRVANSQQAASAYFTGVSYGSYGELLKALPLAGVYFLFSPFPWQIQTAKQALGLLDSAWMLCMVWFFLKGVGPLYRRQPRIAVALVTFVLLGVAASSVLQANVGSALRHRTMFSFLMVPVAVAGFLSRSPKYLAGAGSGHPARYEAGGW